MYNLRKFLMLLFYICAFMTLTLVWSSIAQAQAGSNNHEVVDRFITELKSNVISDLTSRSDRATSLLDCLQSNSCEYSEDLIEKFHQFRIYVGLAQYRDLSLKMRSMSHCYIVHSGIRLYFTKRTQAGRDEWEHIQELHAIDQEEQSRMAVIMRQGNSIREASELVQRSLQFRSTYYASIVSSYLRSYPYFSNTSDVTIDVGDLISMISQTREQFLEITNDLNALEGDDRFELMGFSQAVEKSVEILSEAESEIIVSYFEANNNETRFWGKVAAILSNVRTLALATCHIMTYAMAPVLNPVVQIVRLGMGILCSGYGIKVTVEYFQQQTENMIRIMRYIHTGVYDNQVYRGYVSSYMTTVIMAGLYVVPSLPGLVRRAQGIRNNVTLVRAQSLNQVSLSGVTSYVRSPDFREDVKGLARSYGEYYGEELAVNLIFTAGGHYASNMSVFEASLAENVNRGLQRGIGVIAFGDVLAAMN